MMKTKKNGRKIYKKRLGDFFFLNEMNMKTNNNDDDDDECKCRIGLKPIESA